jgi:hypothetical protein
MSYITDYCVSPNHHCRSFVAVGVDPAVMGVGPAVAIPAAVKAAGLEIDDIDLFELNEVCSVVSIRVFLPSYVTIVDARFIHAPGLCISICVLLQQVGT